MSAMRDQIDASQQTVCVVPAPDMPSHWETSGSCHLRTTALPFLICRREWRDVPVNHSRLRRVASFQSRLLPLGNKPGQTFTVSTRNLLDSLLWSGLPAKKMLKVRAGRAGGSHHKARHCWCDDPRSHWRGGRRRCVGRRHLPHRSFVSERSFKPQGVHWALGFYCHKL